MASGRAVILYDADCGFCKWSLAKLLAWDRGRQLRPVALQSAEASALLPEMDEEQRMASSHLVSGGGEVHSGGAAAAPMLRLLPGGGPLAGLAEAVPGLVERGYRLVAGNRDRIGPLIGAGAKTRADRQISERS